MALATMRSQNSAKVGLPIRQQPLIFGFLGFLVLALLGPFMTFSEAPTTGDGNPIRQVLYVLLFALFVFAIRPLSDLRRLAVIPIPIIIALAWCWLSMMWAIDPGTGIRRLTLTTIVIWSIFLVVRQLTVEQTLTIIRVALVATLIANWITVLQFPGFGIHQINSLEDQKLVGDWRGIMMHKNIAGAICAVTILAFAFDASRIHWSIRAGVTGLAAVFLFYSQSKTSGAMVIGAMMIGFLMERYKSPYRSLVIGFVFVVSIAVTLVLFLYQDPLHRSLTDPKAFTGRMQIWSALLNYASDNWFTGAGFGSFWNIGGDSPILHYGKEWVQQIASGHSGYLDLLVTVGIVGLLLVVFATIAWPTFRLLSLPPTATTVAGALPFSILFFASGQNVTETSIFDRDVLMNIFVMLSIALIERIVTQYREQQRSQPMFGSKPAGERQKRGMFDLAEGKAR